MAADIQRYLKDEPIAARPPSATYQLQKFARRHKALVAGVAAVFVVLIAGIIASMWEAARANEEQRKAEATEILAWATNSLEDDPERSRILGLYAWQKQRTCVPGVE